MLKRRPTVRAGVMQMAERAELEKYLACRVRNRVVVSKRFPVPPFCITATILPPSLIRVNTLQFRFRGEFRHRCWFRYRCEFRRRFAPSRIPTFRPNPTTRYNLNPNLRHGCFPVNFVLILSMGRLRSHGTQKSGNLAGMLGDGGKGRKNEGKKPENQECSVGRAPDF